MSSMRDGWGDRLLGGPARPGEYTPRSFDVADFIRQEIFEGRLAAGAPVRQEAIAKRLGVSRVPVREALRQLENDGLVVSRPHSGARVAVLNFEECIEIYKIREHLEPLGIAESIPRLTDEQVDRLRRHGSSLEPLPLDRSAWLDADREFHLACYAGIGTPRILSMIVGLWNATRRYRHILLQTYTEADFELAAAEHILLVDAIEARNARAGGNIIRNAIERSRLRLEKGQTLFSA